MQEQGDGVINLTLFVPDDAAVMCAADADPELRERFDFPADFVPSLKHSQEVVSRWQAEIAAGTRFPFAVRSAVSNELLGGCELRPLGRGFANVSYWTYRPHRNQGVATRALKLVCAMGFTRFFFHTLEALIDPGNQVSQKVASAAGFENAGSRGGRLRYLLRAGPQSTE